MEFKFKTLFMAAAIAVFGLVACETTEQPEKPDDVIPDGNPESGITNIDNPNADNAVSYRGATVAVKFDAAASWTASISCTPETDALGKEWAKINENTVSGTAKKGSAVRITIEENKTSEERTLVLTVTPEGYKPVEVATLTQAAHGTTGDSQMNTALNTFMHEILAEDYLFVDAYNQHNVDLTVPYNEFLPTHLLALGDVNIEDGGYYRASLPSGGQRYIYSSIVEVAPQTKAAQVNGLGFGPFFASPLSNTSNDIGLAASYVRRGSPAEKVGLRRGDILYGVNGTRITRSNYSSLMNSLYANPTGAYTFAFLRFEDNGDGGYALNAYETTEAAYAGPHLFDPVLHASVLSDPNDESVKIGYLVFETFDLNSHETLVGTINEFASQGITDLILDLRFNYGGAVAQSRWLSGCIAGAANGPKTFCQVVFNDGSTENWTFENGYTQETDNLGKPRDLGLERLFVIGSYNTASASELLINSLRGIDFPVKLYGCRTEGKNVGMNVSYTEYKGRGFQFQPVTFYVRNAKGWGDYPDGFIPDEYVNNDNNSTADDADNVFPYSFGDWGNMDFNIALQWAYCDATGKDRWTHTPGTKSAPVFVLEPMEFQPMDVPAGKAGNLIFVN